MSVSAVGSASSSYYAQQSGAASQFSQFFNNLQKLQQQNPSQLKSTLTNIADELNAAAQQASGPQAQRLSALATKFQQAAQTGDISQLRGGHGGHHHHSGGAQSASSTSSTSSSSTSSTAASQQNSTQSLFDMIFQQVSQAANGNS